MIKHGLVEISQFTPLVSSVIFNTFSQVLIVVSLSKVTQRHAISTLIPNTPKLTAHASLSFIRTIRETDINV